MPKVIARVGETEYLNPTLVNVGDWFGKTWLLVIGGHVTMAFVVEAGSERYVLDEFVDSQWGHLIISDEETGNNAGNESKAVDLDYVHIFKCEVDYDGLVLEENELPAWNAERVLLYNALQAGHEEERSPETKMEFRLKALYDRMLDQEPPESNYGEWHMHHVNLEMVHTAIVIMDKLWYLETIYKEKADAS